MRVRFADLELDEDRRELSRAGEPLAVEPRVFDLVAYLVRQRHRTVSKDELLEQLWPDRDVQEGALSVCVHRARRLVEESGQRVIRTEARRGYRFVAAVELLRERAGGRAERELFVGRSRELAELHRAVEDMLPSRLRTFEVCGEEGSGKTAILEELGTHGRLHKLEVWRVAPSPEAEPYTIWVQIISAYIARYDVRAIRRAMGTHLDDLACIVPALRRWCRPPVGLAAPELRERLLTAIPMSVMAATARRPGLLMFDDLDRADPDSLAAMERVVADCTGTAVLIGVALRRETTALAGLMRRFRSLEGHRRLALSGLDEDGVRAMLEDLARAPVPEAVVARAAAASRGLPGLVQRWWRDRPRDLGSTSAAGESAAERTQAATLEVARP